MIALNALSRLCAVPCQAIDIAQAKAIATESGQLFFDTPVGIISRIALTGLLVAREGQTAAIDDGTGQVLIRPSDPSRPLPDLALGTIIFCIGRVRSVGNEVYVSSESMTCLRSTGWLAYRKVEATLFRQGRRLTPESAATPKRTPEGRDIQGADPSRRAKERSRDGIIDTIRLLDAGDGADLSLVLARIGDDDDERIRFLIKQGDVYEHRPGRIKVLD